MEQFDVQEGGYDEGVYSEYGQPYEPYASPRYYENGQPVAQPYAYESVYGYPETYGGV
jgi:hypothetical protein